MNIVNDKDKVMNSDQNWLAGERIIGAKIKIVKFLLEYKPQRDFMS